LLGIGKFTQRSRTAKNENGKGGELRGADAAFAVAHAEAAKKVNGRGVQAVGDFGDPRLRFTFVLDKVHLI